MRRRIRSVPPTRVAAHEAHRHRELPGAGEDDRLGVDLGGPRAEELVREPEHDPGAVAGRLVGAGGAAMLEPVERDQAAVDRLVDRPAVEAGDAGDAAAVVEERGIVDAREVLLAGGGRGRSCLVVLASHQSAPRLRADRCPPTRGPLWQPGFGDRTAARKGYGNPDRSVGNRRQNPRSGFGHRDKHPLPMRAYRVSMNAAMAAPHDARRRTVRSRRVRRAPGRRRTPTTPCSSVSATSALADERERLDGLIERGRGQLRRARRSPSTRCRGSSPAADWDRLAAGLAQRVRALNAFLADVYGERRIVAAGVVPARVIDDGRLVRAGVAGMGAAIVGAASPAPTSSAPPTARSSCSRTTCARRRVSPTCSPPAPGSSRWPRPPGCDPRPLEPAVEALGATLSRPPRPPASSGPRDRPRSTTGPGPGPPSSTPSWPRMLGHDRRHRSPTCGGAATGCCSETSPSTSSTGASTTSGSPAPDGAADGARRAARRAVCARDPRLRQLAGQRRRRRQGGPRLRRAR